MANVKFQLKDLNNYYFCQKLFYNEYFNRHVLDYIRIDKDIEELIAKKLRIKKYKSVNKIINQTQLDNYEEKYIFNSKFMFMNLVVDIPLMVGKQGGYDIYFYNFSVEVKMQNLKNEAVIYWVLNNNNINVDKIKIIYLNNKYVQAKDTNENLLFKVSSKIYHSHRYVGDITKYIKQNVKDYSYDLYKMRKIISKELKVVEKPSCNIFIKCELRDLCYNVKDRDYDDLLFLFSAKNKKILYEQNVRSFKNLTKDDIEFNHIQQLQIAAVNNKIGYSYNHNELLNWLNQFAGHKLAFLDFEWETYAIPKYSGLKPFGVMCFQYSLDILDNNVIKHHDFIGYNDTREQFIKSLIRDMDKDTIILAYNAKGAEKLRIKELAQQFTSYSSELLAISERVVDMATPFINGFVYHEKMVGQFSLKAIYNAVSEKGTYDDLKVSKPMAAVGSWRKLEVAKYKNPKDVKDLLDYCNLDTKSMIVIYKWLNQIVLDNKANYEFI